MDALELCAMVNGFEGTETHSSKVVLVYEMTRSAGQRPGECLADGFARFGQTTLYLELGAPGASESWTPNGLTAILEEAQAGKSTTIYLPNLAGSKASGFSASDLRSIVESAAKRFEVVVISTGPISDSPDAYLARPLTNIEVVFVTYGKVAITDLKEAQLHAQAMKGGQCLLVGRPRGHVLGVASDQRAA
jgi:hypothetical protein